MQQLSIADREVLLSDILNQAIAAIGRYRLYAEHPSDLSGDSFISKYLCIDYLSPGYEILYGYTPEEFMANPDLWKSRIHPQDWQAHILPNLALLFTVQVSEAHTLAAEYRIYHKDGRVRWIAESLTVHRDEAANCWTVTSLAVDTTERKRTEILLKVQNDILAQIARGESLQQILDSLMVAIEAQLNGALCSILLLDSQGSLQHGSAPNLPEAFIEATNGVIPGEGVGSCGTASARRERVIVPDIATDSLWRDYKNLALQHGLRACWSTPILTAEGRVLGTFGVYYREPKAPEPADLEVVNLATNIAEIAITRSQSETALRESEAKSRAIIATIPDLMFRVSREGRYLEYFTYHRSFDLLPLNVNPTGRRLAEFVTPEMVERKLATIHRALETQSLQIYEQQIQVGDRLQYEEVRVAPSGTDEVLFMIRDITERKQAEAERNQMQLLLQQSEKEFRALVENSPDIIERFDPQMRHVYVSPSLENLSGIAAQTFIGNTCRELGLDSTMVERWEAAMYRVLATGEKQTVEFSLQTHDGTHDYEALLVPECADDGTIESVLSIARNVSERKQAAGKLRSLVEQLEQLNDELEAKVAARTIELRDSEERFRSMFEQSPLGISITDLEGYLIRINSSLSQMTGYSEAELLGKHYLDLVHPDDRPSSVHQFQQILQGQAQISTNEKRYVTKTGAEVWVSVTRASIRDRQGQIVYVIGMVQDIRDHKRLEAERHQAQLDLQTQKEFLQRVIDSVPSCIFVKDIEGYTQVSNQATAELYGTTIEATLGKRVTEFDSNLSAAQQTIFNLEDQTVMQTGKPLVKQDYIVMHDQQTRWYQTILKPFMNSQGQIQGLIGNSVDITDRKLAELALQQSEETLRLVVQNMPVMLDAYDVKGNLIAWNRECERVTGYTADEIIHNPNALELLYPDLDYRTQMQARWIANGNDFRDWEWEITCKDGTRKTILWSNVSGQFPIPGWAGWAVGIDISDRKRIETALQESEARYRRIVETAGEGIWVIDTDNKTTFVNDRTAQMLRTTADQMLGRSVFDFMDEDDKHQAEVYIARRHQGINEQHDFKFKRLDGSELWAILETTPILDAEGCYQGALAMMTDITDRKRIEDQLRNLSDRLSLAIKSGAIGIWEWDLVQNVTVWDDRMCELFGISRSEFTGSPQTWLQSMHPEDRATALASTNQALRGEKDFDTEFRVIHPNGAIRFIKASGIAQRNNAGEVVRMIGINLDISDRKQAEEKLREANHTLAVANAELACANRLKDEFLANMSHELRTPLNAVLGLSQVLQEQAFGPLNDKQHQFVDNILSSGNHLLSLINDILDLAKIGSGKFDLERSPVSIHALCETSLNLVSQQAEQKQISLEAELPPPSQLIMLDERRMRQVLINLLSNGVKFTAEGGQVRLRVRIEDETENGTGIGDQMAGAWNSETAIPEDNSNFSRLSSQLLIFEVEDTGIGIAPDDQNKLFQPFFQIDSSLSRRYEGTGLGLVLVEQIVELHGGQVHVTSELGKGSCFTVRIPCQLLPNMVPLSSSPSSTCITPSPPYPLPPSPSLSSTLLPTSAPLILLAEDNQDTQKLFWDYLQFNGFRVVLAQNGIEALHIAQTQLPQIILMDVQMPGMDGLETIQRLKELSDTAMIPVIVVTASVMRGDRERCISAGASDYLSKPVQLQQLLNKIYEWLPT